MAKPLVVITGASSGIGAATAQAFAAEGVKAKAKVMPGTTRHLEIVKWTIDNVMASEPDMPLWAGLSTNEIPTELGKLLTGQAYDGSAKACMDAVAKMVDAKVKEAEL
jgi:multiple sugar transport system substrate-binding protein